MSGHLIVAISASPSPTSKTARVTGRILEMAATPDTQTSHIRLRDLPSEALLQADLIRPEIVDAMSTIEAADGLIIATPIYKAAYSGLLKVFLDILPQFAFAGKVVLPCATGGSMAHVLALDYALRPVLQSMGARHIVQAQFIPESDILVTDTNIEVVGDSRAMLTESIHHFATSLKLATTDRLLGHPRPTRVLSNSSQSRAQTRLMA